MDISEEASDDTNAPIQVVLTADENYAMPLSVVICSTATNLSLGRHITFNIIHNGFGSVTKERVGGPVTRACPDAALKWIELPHDLVSGFRVNHSHVTSVTYARLLIPQLLPDLERVIYLDSDIVVEGDIGELWSAFRPDRAVGAVRDLIGTVGSPGGLSNYRELGLDSDAPYFNAGVLLLDLTHWRELALTDRVLQYVRSHENILQMADQEGLNAVLHDDWYELPSRWNQQVTPRFMRTKPSVGLTEKQDSGIVHFITFEKPWLPDCRYVERELFFTYLDQTDWSGWRVPRWREVYVRVKRRLGATLRRIRAWRW